LLTSASSFSGGLIQTFIWNRIAGQVNQHLPETERYSLSIWSLWKSAHGEFNQFRIWRTHQRFFPDSYLRLWYATAFFNGVLDVFWLEHIESINWTEIASLP
jgi:hypothetical protein